MYQKEENDCKELVNSAERRPAHRMICHFVYRIGRTAVSVQYQTLPECFGMAVIIIFVAFVMVGNEIAASSDR